MVLCTAVLYLALALCCKCLLGYCSIFLIFLELAIFKQFYCWVILYETINPIFNPGGIFYILFLYFGSFYGLVILWLMTHWCWNVETFEDNLVLQVTENVFDLRSFLLHCCLVSTCLIFFAFYSADRILQSLLIVAKGYGYKGTIFNRNMTFSEIPEIHDLLLFSLYLDSCLFISPSD